MRILTIGPIFGGGIPLVEDIIEAIQTLAIEHRTLNEPDWVQAYQVAAKARNPLPFYAKVHQALDQALDEFAPDLVLTFALAPLPPGFGQKLKGRGIRVSIGFLRMDVDSRHSNEWRVNIPSSLRSSRGSPHSSRKKASTTPDTCRWVYPSVAKIPR